MLCAKILSLCAYRLFLRCGWWQGSQYYITHITPDTLPCAGSVHPHKGSQGQFPGDSAQKWWDLLCWVWAAWGSGGCSQHYEWRQVSKVSHLNGQDAQTWLWYFRPDLTGDDVQVNALSCCSATCMNACVQTQDMWLEQDTLQSWKQQQAADVSQTKDEITHRTLLLWKT